MKTGHKLLIGLGITATVAAAGAYFAADAIVAQIESHRNRYRVKTFVRDNLKGSQLALDFVDKLSDDDITNLVNLADRFDEFRDRFSEYSGNAKEVADDFRTALVNYAAKIKNKD